MNNRNIEKLQEIIIRNLVPKINEDYALLDIPNHCNIGDNLIWEGELNFLKDNVNSKCKYSSNLFNFKDVNLKKINVILFHGGGNWGDLYRECQDFRNEITERYTNKKIIVFPQTVWYNDKSLIEQDCAIYQKHPDVTICLRDKDSFDLLAKYISKDKLLLIPDMAFFVKIPVIAKGHKTLFMLRTDSEVGCCSSTFIPSGCDVKDWPTYSNNTYLLRAHLFLTKFLKILSVKMQKIPVLRGFVDPMYGLNKRNNRQKYIRKGIDFFSQYDTVYTTRLHGLILGIIMGLKIVIVDNKYNKCLNFYNTWLTEFDDISLLK